MPSIGHLGGGPPSLAFGALRAGFAG